VKIIYKYPIKVYDEQAIRMPQSAELLSVQCQAGWPCVWAMVDTDEPMVLRDFGLVATGEPCERIRAGKHVGTFQMRDGTLVFHLFDLGEQVT
jgi:hypothetical protein